ncbi:cellulase (glycosyl hydrolase family 5) [Roseibium hamelinense]|uniref:Cellulase (Glycosyl hydrolase family 5) n=1 Tax=Roseibium hamelinense TaxID=150831 RepID=A0A562TBA6_9HYPH|nr:cellulase family glycosylhydrolase [Roseibium hamelinense]MTI45592.1 glycosyl hydrolase [Roseibium hamelinense]TWI90030.1 cellulase (glycosyl hydrolase family 5) [Roseibium hamelinense]
MIKLFRAAALCAALAQPAQAADLIQFWDTPQKGGNSFNAEPPDADYFEALADTGATWVRLAFSKWPGARRDFLIGSAGAYTGLEKADLETLRQVLDAAHGAGLKVVVVPLSLPGSRWSQQNDSQFDDRLWSDTAFADQAIQFWKDLADALKDHPAIAAYNLLNEPAPEKPTGLVENGRTADLQAWQTSHSGTPRDLPWLYERMIGAIREVDPVTPVMVDSGYYANPRALAAWPKKLTDERVLYAFHMYEPYAATSSPNMKRDTPLRYPGVVTDYDGKGLTWTAHDVAAHIGKAYEWADRAGVPSNRIVAAEFGCMRRWQDCGAYLTDVMDALDKHNGHWAFYSFREDVWEGMDYELPQDFPPGRFYWLMEEGKAAKLPRNGQLMELLKARMAN